MPEGIVKCGQGLVVAARVHRAFENDPDFGLGLLIVLNENVALVDSDERVNELDERLDDAQQVELRHRWGDGFFQRVAKLELVLVVDDNPINLIVARGLVEQAGYRVQTARNGREAVEAASKDFALS